MLETEGIATSTKKIKYLGEKMGFRGTPGPKRALLWYLFIPWSMAACGQQDPSFTEDQSLKQQTITQQSEDGVAERQVVASNTDSGDPNEILIDPNSGQPSPGDSYDNLADYGEDDDLEENNDSQNGDSQNSDSENNDNSSSSSTSSSSGGDENYSSSSSGSSSTSSSTSSSSSGDSGSVTPDPVQVVQELVQPSPGAVDILFVVDSSGSMSEEQTYLGQNFSAFINSLNDTGYDFQVAVTSSDVCQDQVPDDLAQRVCPLNYGGNSSTRLRGSFRGAPGEQILYQGQQDLVANFSQYTAVGTNGSGFEHGLTAAKLAIEKDLAGENDHLIRDNAFLAVVVVSDEEDDGIGLGMTDSYNNRNFVEEGITTYSYTDADFISLLSTVKGSGKFAVSTITGTRDNDGKMCTSPHSNPKEEGTQYISAANKTGGIVQSICETNWSQSLGQIGFDINAQVSQVVLEKEPANDAMKVFVDDQENNDWSYIASNNSVKFNAGAVPPAGSVIRIDYFANP